MVEEKRVLIGVGMTHRQLDILHLMVHVAHNMEHVLVKEQVLAFDKAMRGVFEMEKMGVSCEEVHGILDLLGAGLNAAEGGPMPADVKMVRIGGDPGFGVPIVPPSKKGQVQ